jgi:uncharacterized protein (DUF2236 family)
MGDGVFADDSTIRRIGREGILLAAGGAASIMQTSHPKIAQGVHEHSDFAGDPVRRLRNTAEWMYAVLFGTRAEAERISAAVHAMHEKVTGPGYRANEPELQVWVNATLLTNAVDLYERMFGRFDRAELEAYYLEQKAVAELIGCPVSAHPPTYADFLVYYREMVESLEVTAAAREVAHQVLHPRVPWPARPVLGAFRLFNIGLMPERLRRQYGWRWTRAHEAAFRAMLAAISLIYPRLPLRVRTMPREFYLRSMRRRFGRGDPARRRRRTGAAARPAG